MKQIVIVIIIISIFNSCKTKLEDKIPKNDKQKMEILLSKYKRFAFLHLYRESVRKSSKNFKLVKNDSLYDLTLSELSTDYCLFIDFYSKNHPTYNDENYDLLIKKWLKKDYPPYAPLDNPNIKTTMDMKRALDFQDSEDLKVYIDSLRSLYYRKYINNELTQLDCIRRLK